MTNRVTVEDSAESVETERRDRQPTSAMDLRGDGSPPIREILTKIEADFDDY